MKFIKLPARPASWDTDIEGFPTKTLFQESAWLDFMTSIDPRLKVDYFEIRLGSTVGYYCAYRLRRFFFSVYATPTYGYLGEQAPLLAGDVDQRQLAESLLTATRENSIHRILLRSGWLDAGTMEQAGFSVVPGVTHVCSLASTEEEAWAAMKGICRTRIRKAEKNGLVAELTNDPLVADYFYRYYSAVLKKKGRKPNYGQDSVRRLMSSLLPRERLFAVWVKKGDRVIGSAFYAHDDRDMFYLDGASDPEYLDYSPNELLHWTAMKAAIARGIKKFYIGGGPEPSLFTKKFGGHLVPNNSFYFNLNQLYAPAERVHRTASRIMNWIRCIGVYNIGRAAASEIWIGFC